MIPSISSVSCQIRQNHVGNTLFTLPGSIPFCWAVNSNCPKPHSSSHPRPRTYLTKSHPPSLLPSSSRPSRALNDFRRRIGNQGGETCGSQHLRTEMPITGNGKRVTGGVRSTAPMGKQNYLAGKLYRAKRFQVTESKVLVPLSTRRTYMTETNAAGHSKSWTPSRNKSTTGKIQPQSIDTTMKALVYKGIDQCALEERPIPEIQNPSDAIVKVVYTTICGTDTHILHGDVPTCTPGRILGHEGVGIVHEPGPAVSRFKKGDRVLINCISSCATCDYCRRGMPSHCVKGGWILGNTIDGTQAEYVRIPLADSGLHHVPEGVDEKSLVMLSDIFPTGLECGVQNGKVQPGSTVAIVGAGPVGLAALMTSKLYSPSLVIMIDKDPNRLKVAKKLGADHTVNSGAASPLEAVMGLTNDIGCDAVIEAVGIPATLELAQDLVAPGGTIANVGVHGKSCVLKIEKLWVHNISLTTRLVDTITTPMLLKLFAAGSIDPGQLITHEFPFKEMEKAYTTFKAAAEHDALKMLIAV